MDEDLIEIFKTMIDYTILVKKSNINPDELGDFLNIINTEEHSGIIITSKIADVLMYHGYDGKIYNDIDFKLKGRNYIYTWDTLMEINGNFDEILDDITNELYKELEY
jgi:hypothetical protein